MLFDIKMQHMHVTRQMYKFWGNFFCNLRLIRKIKFLANFRATNSVSRTDSWVSKKTLTSLVHFLAVDSLFDSWQYTPPKQHEWSGSQKQAHHSHSEIVGDHL